MTYEDFKQMVSGLSGEEAVARLSQYIDAHEDEPGLDEALTLRGMKRWGMQQRAAAINDYLAAIRLNPDSRAVQALKAANDILDYYNKDLYNP